MASVVEKLNQNKMILLILGIAIIAALYLFTVVSDDYSNWGEEYMDEEFEKQEKLNKFFRGKFKSEEGEEI